MEVSTKQRNEDLKMRGLRESPACILEIGCKYVPGMDRREPVHARDPKKLDEALREMAGNGRSLEVDSLIVFLALRSEGVFFEELPLTQQSSILQDGEQIDVGQYTTNRTGGFYAPDHGGCNGRYGESESTTVEDDLLTRHRDIGG